MNTSAQKDFPFGNNIHFAYSVNSSKFLFIHSSLTGVLANRPGNDGQSILSKIEPEDQPYLHGALTQVLSGRFSGRITFKLLCQDGPRWLDVTPFLVKQEEETLITGSVVDVTAEVLDLQTLTKFTDKKNSILHMLGHELRGPLNIAKSLTKTITKRLDDPALIEKTGHIATILQESIDMISDLLKREFLETAEAELIRKRVNIVKLVKDYLEECKRAKNVAGITFKLTSSSDRILVRLDHSKFMQVVNNLISNSLKFTPSGGTISITITENGDQVNFIFSDSGIGIPETLMPEIFEKFTAARRTGLQGEPTLGLGLSIVKTIIRWHNGHIRCESEEGKGTSFFITIPKNLPG